MKELWGMEHLSIYRGCVEGASEGGPSLWTLEDMLRKSPDTGTSLHPRGTWFFFGGGRLIYWGL